MRTQAIAATGLAGLLLLPGCAQTPLGPTVAVMPNPRKSFDEFQADQAVCKNYAASQVAGQAERANTLGVGTAVLGTALGAGLGAAIGGGQGAAIGAASGALGGTALGAGASGTTQYSIQQQYDNAYAQCQYAKGNQVERPPPVVVTPPPVVAYPAPGYYYQPPPPVYYSPGY